MQTIILMQCSECKRKNYCTTKNKNKHPEKLNFNKYCSHCRRHVAHKETKA